MGQTVVAELRFCHVLRLMTLLRAASGGQNDSQNLAKKLLVMTMRCRARCSQNCKKSVARADARKHGKNVGHLTQTRIPCHSPPTPQVFHCMFSQSRGPRCARLFCDRLQDTDNVKVFILEGGFGKWEHDQRDMVETPASAAHHGQGPMVGPKNFYVYGEGAVSQEQKEQGGQKGDGGGD